MGFDAYKENVDNDVTVSLTKDSIVYKSPYRNQSKKWTVYLVFCCLTVAMASFQFGYNISSLNKPSPLIKEFIRMNFFMFREYHEKYKKFHDSESWINGNATKLYNGQLDYDTKKSEYISCRMFGDQECIKRMEGESKKTNEDYQRKYNMTLDQFLVCAGAKIANSRKELESNRGLLNEGTEKVNKYTGYLWTLLNCLFVLGGMIGAYKSKSMLDFFGRKNAILVHYIFTILGSIIVFGLPAIKSPICLGISRFLFGIQGAMSCSLVPVYLNEISPSSLRGQIGVIPQIGITLGILVGQLFGLDQILGSSDLWNYLLAIPIIPALVGLLLLLLFFPETPKALLIKNREHAAKEALERLRHSTNITAELDEIKQELATHFKCCNECHRSWENNQNVSIFYLITAKEFRWQLITAVVLHIAQQFSGINAIFFYSSDIFKSAGISEGHIQYAILLTGLVNLIATLACIPLIDRLGRKPLLVIPMITILVNYVLLIVFLTLKGHIESESVNALFSYFSVVCIVIFIIFYAIGLGPIPFIYSAEVFPQNVRTSGMAVSIFSNWTSALILTFLFPILESYLKQYVFVAFILVISAALVIVFTKMPETKGKTTEQINEKFRVTKFSVLQNNLSPGVAL